jgi:hypothetical protein
LALGVFSDTSCTTRLDWQPVDRVNGKELGLGIGRERRDVVQAAPSVVQVWDVASGVARATVPVFDKQAPSRSP